jgi:hypothetical protein
VGSPSDEIFHNHKWLRSRTLPLIGLPNRVIVRKAQLLKVKRVSVPSLFSRNTQQLECTLAHRRPNPNVRLNYQSSQSTH